MSPPNPFRERDEILKLPIFLKSFPKAPSSLVMPLPLKTRFEVSKFMAIFRRARVQALFWLERLMTYR